MLRTSGEQKDGKLLIWTIVGFVAGLLDYAFALGYGLVASLILVVLIGMDPKNAVGVIVVSQLFSLIPAFLSHFRTGNVKRVIPPYPILLFSVSTSILTLFLPLIVINIDAMARRLLYSLTLILALAVIKIKKRVRIRNRYLLPIFSIIAALDKVIVGGGLSLIFVAVQTMFSIDPRTAIATTPLLKLIPTLTTSLGYISLGEVSLLPTLAMTSGALLSTVVAPKALKRIGGSEVLVEYLLLLAAILSVLRVFLRR